MNKYYLTTLVLALTLAAATIAPAQEGGKETAMPDTRTVIMTTNYGDIKIELDYARAPVTCANFEQYVNDGFYAGTIYHRVISNFMIQGGGFNQAGEYKETRDPIANEAGNGLQNERGTIAMARTSVINSATAQFFINVKDNPFLNHRDNTVQGYGYAVFGRVVEGMETVDAIRQVTTGTHVTQTPSGPMEMQDWPVEPVIIEKVVFTE